MGALVEELSEHGYSGTSMERIATRAGVAKTTLYRRWGGVDQIVVELFTDATATAIPVPDTGSFEGDLRELTRSAVGLLLDPLARAIFDIVVGEAVHNPVARTALTQFFDRRVRGGAIVVERAVQRGEVPADTDPAEVIRQAGAPYFARIYVTGDPISLQDADRAASVTALAAREGLFPLQATSPAG
ncbi:TetR/AcrR family transcriptional regulator [Kineosporia babensis]|uniref:TetR/AcrR family transcriptional regulator n=1 Tax=Kineosporia babensis TaxID=499548 RepID=A0A9X1NMF8_9ACTN|nr:TetR/AcrR family transcriptional regulator [Kineosporia babensis]MCD5316426.1 TetR/AcrR family transcriptional regulator [Kineosporia babensis]